VPEYLLSMKPATTLSILVFVLLAGCTTPPAGDLILTEEDMRLRRQPADPCPHEVATHVTYYK